MKSNKSIGLNNGSSFSLHCVFAYILCTSKGRFAFKGQFVVSYKLTSQFVVILGTL